MSVKLTHDEWLSLIAQKDNHNGATYTYLTEYTTGKAPVRIKCNCCGCVFTQLANNHYHRGSGCPECAIVRRTALIKKTQEQFELDVAARELRTGLKFTYLDPYISSQDKMRMICGQCGYEFIQNVSNHMFGVGCIRCAGVALKTQEQFELDVAAREKRTGMKFSYPEPYVNANTKIQIICGQCGHSFLQSPDNHLNGDTGCPRCTTMGHSKKQISWFAYIVGMSGITMQHAGNVGEFKIPGIGMVDGYCKETNTVYEFHGIFFHGHPSKYTPTDTNPLIKKTYGELYDRTLARDQKIRDLGYNLVVMWEHDWDLFVKENKKVIICQQN